jgi:Flp pilus assembly protein TadG
MRSRLSRAGRPDEGAAAVEFALVLPLLLLVVFGLVDFGRALNEQILLGRAAQQGARAAALRQTDTVTRTETAARPLVDIGVEVTPCPTNTVVSSDATVVTTHQFTFITPVDAFVSMFGGDLGTGVTLTGRAVMRCVG